MSKYGKEDVYVTASDGSRVLREMLSEYEKTLAKMPKGITAPPEILETIQKEENMTPSDNTEVSKITDDAVVINYIMLARIYDLLTIIADSLGRGEDVLKIMNLHQNGQLMSPPPVLSTEEDKNEE
jgi:hypothetical protein